MPVEKGAKDSRGKNQEIEREEIMEIIDTRARSPTPEFKKYFSPEITVRGNLKVGAKYVSPAYFAGSLEYYSLRRWKKPE